MNTPGDFRNNDDGPMMRFLKGGTEFGQTIGGDFDIGDYLNALFHTGWAYNFKDGGANDLLRRYLNNILVGSEYYELSMTDQEWKTVTSLFNLWWLKVSSQKLLPNIHKLFTTAETAWPGPSWSWIPLVVDLDRDGVETTSVSDGSYFDHDRNGFAERTGWASPDDGLLAWDKNSDGIINDGTELFNDPINYPQATNGFQVLAQLDDNSDGKIDANDAVWSQLKIWQDYDGDGYSNPDELWAPSDLGITAINTNYTDIDITDAQGNQQKQDGTFTWSDGTTGTVREVWLQNDKMFTVANEWLDVPSDIAALPDLQAYGNVYDLQQAMVRETGKRDKALDSRFHGNDTPVPLIK